MHVRPPELEAFCAAARARPALWRTFAGALLAAALWLFTLGTTLPFATRLGGFGTPAGLLLFLASFAGLLAGTLAATVLLQRRRAATLLGPGGFRLPAFAAGLAVVVAASVPILAISPTPRLQMPPSVWMGWLPLALPAVLLQAATEEIVFRGFLLQSLAARFRSPLAWWIAPSLLFGALHWNPAALGANAPLALASTTVIGLALADVTARTGNLSVAIGLHFANNAAALLVVAMPSPVSGLALFLAGVDPDDAGAVRSLMLVDLAVVLAAWLVWRVADRRRRLHSRGPGPI